VDDRLRGLLDRLYQDGLRHDAAESDRLRRRRNLEPDAAALLSVVVQAMGAVRVLEIGTSNGYSAVWLADAVRPAGGTVTSVDVDAQAQRAAAANLKEAGLTAWVDLVLADGGMVLGELPAESHDVVLLDAERTEYARWWPHPVRVLRRGALVIDNVLSHPDEVAPVLGLIGAEPGLSSAVVPTGKGQLYAVRTADVGDP
jgi:predicted O-methyltransferase YrrM